MLHPAVLVSLVLLVLNDHVWKARFPGLVTGKLSDLFGLVFFPVLLWSLAEVAARRAPMSRRLYVGAVVVTGAFFALAKTWSPVSLVYRAGIAMLQWPFHAGAALLDGASVPALGDVSFVVDPTDLVALPLLMVPLWLGRRRARRR